MTTSPRVVPLASEWLWEAMDQTEGDVLLTSPYLSFDTCDKIAKSAASSEHQWTLVTTLDPSAVANGFLTVQGLGKLLDAGVEVRHVERLHAKCFVVGRQALVGSANLTGAGLGSSANPNRELGVELDVDQAAAAVAEIRSWPARLVSKADLDQLSRDARGLTEVHPIQHDALDPYSALARVEQLLVDARDQTRSLWLKLEYGAPALDGWRRPAWFASPKKGKPKIKPRDLVLVCSKATHDCYAVVEVTSDPEFQPPFYLEVARQDDPGAAERWPWVSYTSPRFVPTELTPLKINELGASAPALQNGHIRLQFDQFTAAVRALARLASE